MPEHLRSGMLPKSPEYAIDRARIRLRNLVGSIPRMTGCTREQLGELLLDLAAEYAPVAPPASSPAPLPAPLSPSADED